MNHDLPQTRRQRQDSTTGRPPGFGGFPTTGRAGDSGGFTVAELAVVMVIIGVLLAAAVPNFATRSAWNRAQGGARELGSRISYIRQLTVARRTPYRLVLNRPDHSYTFERQQNDSTWVRDPNEIYPIAGIAGMTSTANGDASANDIYFEAGGTIRSQDAPLQVHLLSARGDTATVVLVRTGRVTVRMFRVSP